MGGQVNPTTETLGQGHLQVGIAAHLRAGQREEVVQGLAFPSKSGQAFIGGPSVHNVHQRNPGGTVKIIDAQTDGAVGHQFKEHFGDLAVLGQQGQPDLGEALLVDLGRYLKPGQHGLEIDTFP